MADGGTPTTAPGGRAAAVSGHPQEARRSPRLAPVRRHPVVLAAVAAVLGLSAATALLLVWPKRDATAAADAIVVFNGPGPRQAKGIELARRGLAPVLVFSQTDPSRDPACRLVLPHVQILCFRPSPLSTRGESEEVARLASEHEWHRILLVVGQFQASRARLRLRRCYAGQFLVQTVPVQVRAVPRTLAYEWGAMIKALVWQRRC